MRTRFTASSIVIAVLVTFALAAPVAAAGKWTTFKQSGTQASAFRSACVENGDGTATCESVSIDVFSGTSRQSGQPTVTGDQVCYGENSETFELESGRPVELRSVFGCALHAGTATVDRLNSVAVAPTVIELIEVVCDSETCSESAAGSITVQGAWTGIGPTASLKGRFSFDDGGCAQVSAERSTSRPATFSGPFVADDARIGTGTFTFRSSCPIEPA
jgi:hypothetical protein